MGTHAVIIVCAQCETRFQLDDARIPAKGAKVRCSQCKHAFYVRRPDARAADAVDEVVAEATEPGASSAPPATRDLADAGARERAGIDGGGDFADWEFEEEPPSATPGAAAGAAPKGTGAPEPAPPASPAAAAAPESPAAIDEGEDAFGAPAPPAPEEAPARGAAGLGDEDLDALGNPEEWNLLADSPPPAADDETDDPLEALLGRGAAEEAPAGAGASPQGPPQTAPRSEAIEPAAPQAKAPARTRRLAVPRGAGDLAERLPALGSVAAGAGWVASLTLVGLALFALGSGALEPTAARAPEPRAMPFADGRAAAVEGAYVENALAGPVYVVSGRYEVGRLGRTRGLEVQLLDARGAAIPGATAWAGPALSEVQLRERAPEALRDALARGAGELAWAQDGRFHAVFAEVPPGAEDFTLRARPLPWTSPPPEPATSGTSPPAPSPSRE